MFKDMFDNPKVKKFLKGAGTVAGAIIIEGIKGVAIKSAANVITTSFDSGIEGVKKMKVEDVVGRKKTKIKLPKVESKVEKDKVVVEAEFETVGNDGDKIVQ